jgi:hypothetical protein
MNKPTQQVLLLKETKLVLEIKPIQTQLEVIKLELVIKQVLKQIKPLVMKEIPTKLQMKATLI